MISFSALHLRTRCRVPLQITIHKGLHSFVCLAALLLCVFQTSVLPQTRRSLSQQREARSSVLSTNAASMRDWEDRLMSNDLKVRANAQATLVQEAARSLPLLRRLLHRDSEDLHEVTFEIIRRIGPPAIPLLVDLLRQKEVSMRRF